MHKNLQHNVLLSQCVCTYILILNTHTRTGTDKRTVSLILLILFASIIIIIIHHTIICHFVSFFFFFFQLAHQLFSPSLLFSFFFFPFPPEH
jgi:hypothetical protein